ncbi:MAG TPA: type III-B CRISPR module RAMP protein Cmr1 [Methylomusa anaerophila]|uniref:CRISPR type III-associated protein domain-containing protein n=1 Tax=Methylomusa anaerophila TaxID=1930071 RepID=A0A348ALW2_9FIRM|nr:type III-B CRISPR module RAMP protein Cmr1 [Methylomusa anaerophila]BBB92060.1 hypothetical protein MAMMFC1_02745 [Methylomusa anaerophila]HML87928.1 type III-B CRISPR module RAMP protein Cmr1 [Methylomusa anaerophila]
MQRILINCNVLTPMFITGVDGRTPELRPASLKGVLRFWWRAVQLEEETKELCQRESSLFGGATQETGRSKIFLQISSPSGLNTNPYPPLPHHTGRTGCKPCLDKDIYECKKNSKIPAIDLNQNFCILLKYIDLPEYFSTDQLISLCKLIAALSGLGKRSRRGFGSFTVTAIAGIPVSPFITIEDIYKWLQDLAPEKYKLDNDIIRLTAECWAKYPFIEEIQIGREYDSVDNLAKTIGMASHDWDSDYTGFNRRQDPNDRKQKLQRMASPIHVSIIKSQQGFRPVITSLHTEFPPGWKSNDPMSEEFKGAIL